MELNKYSKNITQDPTQPAAQAMLHAIGLSEEDLKKPLVVLPKETMPLQFVHETDLTRAILHCLVRRITGIFNIAGAGTLTVAEMVRIIGNRPVWVPSRLLYPLKRVDFDPNGERNPQNRGVSEFERISWDEATDIVASEIKRARAVGPGAVAVDHGSHHQWGNLGHYLSGFNRFWNLIGVTKLVHSPDSWEGWFWGAMHHWGNSMRLGAAEPYGTVEDCLKEADMIVFWSSDPDTTYGFEGTQRRRWAKELGIEMVHIDPFRNHTAAHLGGKWIAPKPGTDPALSGPTRRAPPASTRARDPPPAPTVWMSSTGTATGRPAISNSRVRITLTSKPWRRPIPSASSSSRRGRLGESAMTASARSPSTCRGTWSRDCSKPTSPTMPASRTAARAIDTCSHMPATSSGSRL